MRTELDVAKKHAACLLAPQNPPPVSERKKHQKLVKQMKCRLRKRDYRLQKKDGAALLAPQNPPPVSEGRIRKRQKHAQYMKETRRVAALNNIGLQEKGTQTPNF
jgi:hypothetical protein